MKIEWRIHKQDWRRGWWRLTCICGYATVWVPNWAGRLSRLAAVERSKQAVADYDTHVMEEQCTKQPDRSLTV